MQEHDISWRRAEMIRAQSAPPGERGVRGWIVKSFFATPGETLLTLLGLLLLWYTVPPLVDWTVVQAQWTGTDRTFCATIAQGGMKPEEWSGACWAFVNAKFGQFMFGTYLNDERWRPITVALLLLVLLVPLAIPKVPYKWINAVALFGVFPVVAFVLLVGGVFGLPIVETAAWGGMLVTLTLSFVAISVSLPLGIVLALGRRSELPAIRTMCVVFIETIRGVPLVTILFMASVMLPLFLPEGITFDKFLRALIGVSIFSSAYMAEVIRGGLQAIPKGQYEGADSVGLSYPQKMCLIILPQALKVVIPGIVNTFIGMFKDTSLVYIISMFDLLGVVRQNFSDATWATPQTPPTGLIFAGFLFWIFCFGMSRYSIFMERRLNTSHK